MGWGVHEQISIDNEGYGNQGWLIIQKFDFAASSDLALLSVFAIMGGSHKSLAICMFRLITAANG